jgi:hypothetical protein
MVLMVVVTPSFPLIGGVGAKVHDGGVTAATSRPTPIDEQLSVLYPNFVLKCGTFVRTNVPFLAARQSICHLDSAASYCYMQDDRL